MRHPRASTSVLPLVLLFLSAAAPVPTGVAAQERRPFTTEDALKVRDAGIADVTPDGRWIAMTVRTHGDRLGVDHGRFGDPTYQAPSTGELHLVDTRTGAQRPILDGRVQVTSATWSPDGGRLAFLQFQDDRWRLRLYQREGGRVTTVSLDTPREIAAGTLEWRPDGSGVLLTLREEGWREEARTAYAALAEGPVVVQDSEDPFLAWESVRDLGSVAVPAVVDLPSGRVRDLLPAGRWSDPHQTPDGRIVSFVRSNPLKTSYEGDGGAEYGVLRLDLDTGDTTVLVPFSTDRFRGEWNGARDAFAFVQKGDVLVRSIFADSARNLTAEHRGPVSATDTTQLRYGAEAWRPDGGALLVSSQRGWHLLDAGSGAMEPVLTFEEDEDARPRRSVEGWSPDGGHLYLSTSKRDRWERGLARLELASGRVEPLAVDGNLYRDWTLSEDGSRLVYTMSDGDRPAEVYAAAPDLRDPRRLTDLNPWLTERTLTRSELVEYLDVDGEKMYGILYYPVGYEEGKRYPLVAEIYEEFFDNGFNQSMNLMANQGWFGFRPSVRLEEGYPGEAWLKGVTAGINTLIDRGLVDGDKLGVHGTSYGGYATNLLITQTDRFAAAINISGKVNIISFLGDSPKITTRNYRAAEDGQDRIGATLWEQPHKYVAHSAVMFADRIDTPLLLLSGEGDWNVPATNQREMYYALRRLGKKVVWVHYMNAGHGAGRAGTESDFHDHWSRIVGWYREHFADEG